jgi:uncharacterized delta-60 repeat protein
MTMNIILRFVSAGFLSASILAAGSAFGQAGALDSTFGNGGVTVMSFASSGFVIPDSIQLQSDGKIVVLVQAGNLNNEVLRFTATGALDTSFGSHGVAVLSPAVGGSMMLQSNGQIVIAGVVANPSTGGNALGVERLNADGTRDTLFGAGGLATASLGTRATGVGEVVLVQPNGDILVGAQLEPIGRRQPFQTILARFNSSGALDTTFGNEGIAIATGSAGCTALALLSDGDYLVVNAQAVARFTSNGTLATAAADALVAASNGSSAPSTPSIVQANGDYLFGGELFTGLQSRAHNAAAEVLRFTETGGADPNFASAPFHYTGAGGSGIEALVHAVALQSDGGIVVVGNQVTFTQAGVETVNGLARLTAAGHLDLTFGNAGTVVNTVPAGTDELSGVVVQPTDDKIVVVGTANDATELTVSRYLGR